MEIGKKILLSFIGVVVIFTAICVYMIFTFTSLSKLQDEGAGRAEDAGALNHSVEVLLEVYPIIADSIINRNFEEAERDFNELKSSFADETKKIRELVDTEQERAWAEESIAAGQEYLDTYENKMFPVLTGNSTVAERAADVMLIMEFELELGGLYPIIADSIINRNMEETRKDLEDFESHMDQHMSMIDDLADTEEERADVQDVKQGYNEYLDFFKFTMLPAINRGASMTEIARLDEEVDGLRDKTEKSLHKIVLSLEEETNEAIQAEQSIRDLDEEIDVSRGIAIGILGNIASALAEEQIEADEVFDSAIQRTIIIAIVVSIIGIAIAVIMALLITNNILMLLGKDPAEILDVTKKIADGDMRVKFDDDKKSDRGVYHAMKVMTMKLTEVVGNVLTGTEQIASASEQLSSGNQDLSNRTEQQATALEETSSAIEEMNSSIRSNADNTGTASQLSSDALEKTEDGSKAVSTMIVSMNEISTSSNRIADIIAVINNIAFQTNLLALNASIEAARAGEQGKGFAVVAVEVRKLAKRSDKAASEIAEIIKTSNKKVDEGVNIANKAGEVLTEINSSVKKVTALVGEISAASQEQLSSVDQIDKTLSSLDENTQKNAALVEEAASSTEELSAQAQELNSSMKFFKLSSRGENRVPVRKKEVTGVRLIENSAKDRTQLNKISNKNSDDYEVFSKMEKEEEFAEF